VRGVHGSSERLSDADDESMNKAKEIQAVLAWLREQLGDRFVVIDHWDADLNAIGVASPEDPHRLVYICAGSEEPERYFVELETAPSEGSDLPYESVGKFTSVDREQLARIVKDHLK
jgi:hypothetical protein